jgi:hypothetical protein
MIQRITLSAILEEAMIPTRPAENSFDVGHCHPSLDLVESDFVNSVTARNDPSGGQRPNNEAKEHRQDRPFVCIHVRIVAQATTQWPVAKRRQRPQQSQHQFFPPNAKDQLPGPAA